MRRRRRPDWSVRVYRYWARPLRPVPEALWSHAHRMQALWNHLVALHDKQRSAIEALGEDRAARRAAWRELELAWKVAVAESGLDWVSGPDVLDRMRMTVRARRVPVAHTRLDRLVVAHRYTGGGVPVSALASSRASRVRLIFPPAAAYATSRRQDRRQRITPAHRDGSHEDAACNRLRVGDDLIRFRVMWHRPLPPAAIVKRVAWCGRLDPLRRWHWTLQITVEEPPVPMEPRREPSALSVVGLDVGWRRFPEHVRIGMVWTGTEAIELRLPLSAPTGHTRRHHLRDGYADLEDYDRLAAKGLEASKSLIAMLPGERPTGWAQMRQGGLRRWLHALEAAAPADPRVGPLRVWRAENERVRSKKLALWTRLLGRRRWLYENLAAWLCGLADVIVWEGGLGIKAMAEAEKSAALEAADRARQWAAPAEFRRLLAQSAARRGVQIVAGVTARSTTTCSVCGDQATPGAALMLRCPAGHEWDQDANAARNLRSQMTREEEQDDGLRKEAVVNTRQMPDIPHILRSVAVPVRAE